VSYDMSINHEEGYIIVHLHEELTKADIDAALKKILIIRREQKVNNILCYQHHLQVPPSKMIVFETAMHFAEESFVGMKLAIVRESLPERMHFFETVATNRSGIVKVFDNNEEAKKWLTL
jgi:hypothetical protein